MGVHFTESHFSDVGMDDVELLNKMGSDVVDQYFKVEMADFGFDKVIRLFRNEANQQFDGQIDQQVYFAALHEIEQQVGEQGVDDKTEPLAGPNVVSSVHSEQGFDGQ